MLSHCARRKEICSIMGISACFQLVLGCYRRRSCAVYLAVDRLGWLCYYAAVFYNRFRRANIIFNTYHQYFFDSDFFTFFQGKPNHLRSMAFLLSDGLIPITNMASVQQQVFVSICPNIHSPHDDISLFVYTKENRIKNKPVLRRICV